MLEPLHVSAAHVDITPEEPYPLFGYAGRPNRFDRIHDTLELNGLLLRQGTRSLLLVTADLLYATEDLEDAALRVLTSKPGLEGATVLFGASHTHYAPSVDASKPSLGKSTPEYQAFVKERLAVLVETLASQPGVPVQVHYASGKASHAVNRRRKGWIVGRHGLKRANAAALPNPKGPKDETLRVITLRDARGEPHAVIWNYACHPVGFPERNAVSSEYPGVVRDRLRSAIGREHFPVLFFQGFAGNIRPPAYDHSRRPVMIVRRMLNGVAFGTFSLEEYNAWSGSLAGQVIPLLQGKPIEAAELVHSSASLPLDSILAGAPRDRTVRADMVTLGAGLRLVGVSAEVMAEYLTHLRSIFPSDELLPVGYTGSVFGYLPTEAMLAEGGYEAGGFLPLFNLSGRFETVVEERTVALLREVAQADPTRPSASYRPR